MIRNGTISALWRAARVLSFGFFLVQLTFVDYLQVPGFKCPLNYPWTGLMIFSFLSLCEHLRDARGNEEALYGARTLFWASLFVYLSSLRWHGCDDLPTALLPFSILERHTLTLDEYRIWLSTAFATVPVKGHLISFYPIGGAILALPVYILPCLRHVQATDHIIHQLGKISASLMCALAVVVFFKACLTRTSRRWAFAMSIAFAFGTNLFSLASQALWQHGPSVLLLIGALYCLQRMDDDPNFAYGLGAFSALAVGTRTTNIFFSAAFLVVTLLKGVKGSTKNFILGALVPGLSIIAYWWFVVGTGLPAEFGWQRGLFSWGFHPVVAAAFLVSPSRGILLYSPIVGFGALGLLHALKGPQRTAALILGITIAAQFMFFTCYKPWTNGFISVGPRYLIELSAVLLYFLPEASAFLATRLGRILWRGALAFSIACHAVGAYWRWDWENFSILHDSVWHLRSHPLFYVLASGIDWLRGRAT